MVGKDIMDHTWQEKQTCTIVCIFLVACYGEFAGI